MAKRARTAGTSRRTAPGQRSRPGHPRDTRTHAKGSAAQADLQTWIVWRDADLLAVNKPSGVASQGGEGLAGINLVDLARSQLGVDQVAVLHRIDRNVSGIVLIATSSVAARAMSRLIAAGKLERRYQALVKGRLTEAAVLRHWLHKNSARNQVDLVDAPEGARAEDAPDGYKLSITRVAPIAEVPSLLGVCTQVHAWPITGRSHQIRAQLAASDFPIVGDPKYGVEAKGLHRPLLHAEQVSFTHPITHAPIEITVPPPWTHDELVHLRRRTS